jgi:WD40 repeat protein
MLGVSTFRGSKAFHLHTKTSPDPTLKMDLPQSKWIRKCLQLSPTHVLLCGDDKYMQIIDIANTTPALNLAKHAGYVLDAIQLSSFNQSRGEEQIYIAACSPSDLLVYKIGLNPLAFVSLQCFSNLHNLPMTCLVELSRQSLATGGMDRTVKILDMQTQKVQKRLKANGEISRLLCLDDGRLMANVCNKNLCMWDLKSGKNKEVVEGVLGVNDKLSKGLIQIDQWKVIYAGADSSVCELDLRKGPGTQIYSHNYPPCGIIEVKGCLVSASYDMDLRVWDITDQSYDDTFTLKHNITALNKFNSH